MRGLGYITINYKYKKRVAVIQLFSLLVYHVNHCTINYYYFIFYRRTFFFVKPAMPDFIITVLVMFLDLQFYIVCSFDELPK